MKERPILFSAPMVRALLNDAKTQTRRVVKPQPDEMHDGEPYWFVGGYRAWQHRGITDPLRMGTANSLPCPYGQPGDRLWVREAWRIGAWDADDGRIAVDYRDSVDKKWRDIPDDGKDAFVTLWEQCCNELVAKGINPDANGEYHWKPGESPLRWRPSIHMPRWASRITLEVTGVRVERLNDISEADAVTEGVDMQQQVTMPFSQGLEWCTVTMLPRTAREAYMHLWESINGPGSLALNPWVWVVEFKRLTDQAKGE